MTQNLAQTTVETPSASSGGPLAPVFRLFDFLYSKLELFPQSLLLLFMRLSAGYVFFASAQTKVVNGTLELSRSTFFIFEHEYLGKFLSGDQAAAFAEPMAYAATYIEFFVPILLFVGFATRLAALPLLGMTAFIQILIYPDAWPTHALWAALLLPILIKGPGKISIDQFLWPQLRKMLG